MADDVVDTIAQYDLDDDFPDYANEQNKELNQIVREKVRLVAQLGLEIEEH
jgi:coiled-coil domain-containing protein 39